MTRFIFGLTGIRGAGKDTVADVLEEAHGFKRVSFANALYAEVAAAFGTSVERLQCRETKETPAADLGLANCTDSAFVQIAHAAGLSLRQNSPRAVLQVWGAEYRRSQNDNYWLDKVTQLLASVPNTSFVVTDCRYRNEARAIVAAGGRILRVDRPAIYAAWAADPRSQHSSEQDLLNYPVDHRFCNEEGDILGLETQVHDYMRHLYPRQQAA